MSAANFDRSLALVLASEGGFSSNAKDPGGATNRGITLATYRQFIKPQGTIADLKALTVAEAATCYRANYWNKIRGDDLPAGVDYATFDFAVNSGPGRSAEFLQNALGVTADGKIGDITIRAAESADAVKLIADLCGRRLAWLQHLSTWYTFGRGWQKRIDSVRTEATKMAVADVSRETIPPPPQKPAEPVSPEPASVNDEADPIKPAAPVTGFMAILEAIVKALFGPKEK